MSQAALYSGLGKQMNQQNSTELISEYRYSILEISRHNFGVEVINVREVLPMPKYTPVPNVDKCILGVFNLRGQIYSIVDLRSLFKLDKKPISEKNFVVLLESDGIIFGVVVDRVLDLISLDTSKIILPAQEMPVQYVQYTTGYYEHKTLGNIYLLDLAAILDTNEIKKYRYE